MKKLLFIIFFLPIFSIAQAYKLGKPASKKLLTTITSDTLNRQFLKITITYDQLNRVVSILQTDNRLLIGSKMQVRKVLLQNFEYDGNNMLPIYRKRATYGYNKELAKDTIDLYEKQFFIYENGKRMGDSIFSNIRENASTIAHPATYSKTENKISRDLDVSSYYLDRFLYSTDIVYKDNLAKAKSSMYLESHNYYYVEYDFKKFDNGINPLQNINIADILSSDMFDFASADEDPEGQPKNKNEPPCLPINYLGWAYLNKNNPTRFVKNGSDSRTMNFCIRKNINTLVYNYNQLSLPVRCKVQVKTINLVEHYVEGITKRAFNFTYKNAVN